MGGLAAPSRGLPMAFRTSTGDFGAIGDEVEEASNAAPWGQGLPPGVPDLSQDAILLPFRPLQAMAPPAADQWEKSIASESKFVSLAESSTQRHVVPLLAPAAQLAPQPVAQLAPSDGSNTSG